MLNKTFRISKGREFFKTKKYGKRYEGKYCTVLVFNPHTVGNHPKVSVVAPNKIAPNIPKRNRIKRLFREAVRTQLQKVPQDTNLVFYCNKKALDIPYEEISAEVSYLIQNIPLPLHGNAK
jgi:ribonuclease P protein component